MKKIKQEESTKEWRLSRWVFSYQTSKYDHYGGRGRTYHDHYDWGQEKTVLGTKDQVVGYLTLLKRKGMLESNLSGAREFCDRIRLLKILLNLAKGVKEEATPVVSEDRDEIYVEFSDKDLIPLEVF